VLVDHKQVYLGAVLQLVLAHLHVSLEVVVELVRILVLQGQEETQELLVGEEEAELLVQVGVILAQAVQVVMVFVVFMHGDQNEQPIRNHRKQCCC
jgi:hypothetical protein